MTYEERQQMILEVLAPRSGDGADCGAIAARALWSWEQMAFHLQPLIGEAGFQALYARTVHLTIPHFIGLTPARQSESLDISFQTLRKDLESLTPAQAAEAGKMLLDTFTQLLSTMIGESLTSRILRSAWTDESSNSNDQEMKK
jgi:hypothetical protein